jgi:hypothetical protein
MSQEYEKDYWCEFKHTFINEKCPDFCFGDKCVSGSKCSKQMCKCLKKKRQNENKRYEDQCNLTTLSKDYNSLEYINDPNYYNVYSYKKNCSCNNVVQDGRYKITNYKQIKKIYQNQYKKPSDNMTGSKKDYYNSIYNRVYQSFYTTLVPPQIEHTISPYIKKNAEYIARRKAIGWIRRYANSQGTTNTGWPAIPIIGTSY